MVDSEPSRVRSRVRRRVLKCSRSVSVRPASSCEVVVATGNPVALIVHMARTRTVDLIVMGTHGYTGLRHILWGSVAEKVIRLAPCPVLVVRHEEGIDQTATTPTRSHYSIAS